MSGNTSDSHLERLAEAVSHFGDAVLMANIRPERIHELAIRLERAKSGQVVAFRLQSDVVEDGEDSDTRTSAMGRTTRISWSQSRGGEPFAAAA